MELKTKNWSPSQDMTLQLYTLGAQRVLYALRGPLSFSTVLSQFEGAETEKIGVIIFYKDIRPICTRKGHALFHDIAYSVSQLLKVLET